jgi:hypothetical protein
MGMKTFRVHFVSYLIFFQNYTAKTRCILTQPLLSYTIAAVAPDFILANRTKKKTGKIDDSRDY